MLLKCGGLSGAKICKTQCKSCRVRQELSNECFFEIFSVGTAENEPFKVSRWFNSFMYPFASALMTRREGGGLLASAFGPEAICLYVSLIFSERVPYIYFP